MVLSKIIMSHGNIHLNKKYFKMAAALRNELLGLHAEHILNYENYKANSLIIFWHHLHTLCIIYKKDIKMKPLNISHKTSPS